MACYFSRLLCKELRRVTWGFRGGGWREVRIIVIEPGIISSECSDGGGGGGLGCMIYERRNCYRVSSRHGGRACRSLVK